MNKKGFTLIEIIVVIVILAVLMAVAVPAVLNYIDAADDAKCIAEAKSVLTASEKHLVYLYDEQRKTTSGDISDVLGKNEREEIVKEVNGNGEMISLYYINGVTQRMIYYVNDKYVVFEGYNQRFEIMDSLEEEVVAETIFNSSEQLRAINDYFNSKGPNVTIDSNASQGGNGLNGVGYNISQFLKGKGIDTDSVTWVMYERKNKRYEIVICNQKVTLDDVGKSFDALSYIYYNDGKIDKEFYGIKKNVTVEKSDNNHQYAVIRSK